MIPERMSIEDVIAVPGVERAVLSIILKDKNKVIECTSDNLFAEHFSVKANQIIYSVCVHLSQMDNIEVFDSMLIYNTVQDPTAKERIDEIGGLDYIEALFISSIANNLPFYIKQLKDKALLRLAYNVGADIQKKVIESEDINIDELLTSVQEAVLNISLKSGDGVKVKKFGEGIKERLRQRAENPLDVLGYAIGWQWWDKITQGLCPNDLTVFCGESKTGKSTLLLNISKILSIDLSIPGLYIDTEMTTEEQEDRLLAITSGVPFEEIRNGKYASDTEYGLAVDKIRAIDEASEKIAQSEFYHVYMPKQNWAVA